MPHAVANRLAAKALENIPVDDILNTFQGLQSPRLLKSFGKRLGYLHDHTVAQGIVKSWLSPGGLLHDLRRLNDDGIQLLQNVAPATPEDVLSAIEAQDETFFSRENPHFSTFVDLLANIAYDPKLFERCVNLLAKFALQGENLDTVQDRLFGLFSLYLSGTEASPDTRENLARRFLLSDDRNEQRLGLGMLRAALQSRHWSSFGTFEFGARPRSFGYHPKTSEEQDRWFARFITLAQETATGGDVHLSNQTRGLLANELRGLWDYPGLRAALAGLARALNDQQPWLEGWRAVRAIKHYGYHEAGGKTIPDGAELLDDLDDMLKPERLSDEIRVFVLNTGYQQFALNEEFDFNDDQKWQESSKRAAARACDLGTVVAGEPQVIEELSQELFTAGNGYLIEFGRGMASTCRDLEALWGQLVEGLELVGDQAWHCGVLVGVLEVIQQRDEPLAQKVLDEAVQNPTLRKFIVNLQASVPWSHTGVERLHKSLDFDDTPSRQFINLARHRPLDAFSETDLQDLMLRILNKPNGAEFVLEGLYMRLHVLKESKLALGPKLKRVGLGLRRAFAHDAEDYDS